MQVAVIEFARSNLGLKDANSGELDAGTRHPCLILMPEVTDVAEFLWACIFLHVHFMMLLPEWVWKSSETLTRVGTKRTFFRTTDCKAARLYVSGRCFVLIRFCLHCSNWDLVSVFSQQIWQCKVRGWTPKTQIYGENHCPIYMALYMKNHLKITLTIVPNMEPAKFLGEPWDGWQTWERRRKFCRYGWNWTKNGGNALMHVMFTI